VLFKFFNLKETAEYRDSNNLAKEIIEMISNQIGPIAKLDKIQFVSALPKTRSGKIMRRIYARLPKGISQISATPVHY
jgi:acetyl-CoA synthetase